MDDGGWNKEQKIVELTMRGEEYTLDTQLEGRYRAPKRLAKWRDREVRFQTASPASPIDIQAYCEERGDIYYCIGYKALEPQKKTLRERMEQLHTAILVIAGLLMPLPLTPTFLWRLEYGVGDNPYFGEMAMYFSIILFGGCRKLLRNAGDCFTKVIHVVLTILYYMYLLYLVLWMLGLAEPV